jgi:4-hydroxybenzoate polyprenyltransferase
MKRALGCSYRQSKYGNNYSDNNDVTKDWAWIWIAVLISTPFLAAFILNPYMWLLALAIFGAYKLVYGKKGK